MKNRWETLVHPPPEIGKIDTSLRYTDILFGFVIKELFVRLQNWSLIDVAVRWQLITGTILVLCSWIGFRRSLNRTSYEVKFFNLPLIKFITDQLMLILYFRLAVMTPIELKGPTVTPDGLANQTLSILVSIFGLYLIWDLLGIRMTYLKRRTAEGREPRYPVIENGMSTKKQQAADLKGFGITVGGGLALVLIWSFGSCIGWQAQFAITSATLLLYRVAKEVRTSWKGL